jgi:hypothetical protein
MQASSIVRKPVIWAVLGGGLIAALSGCDHYYPYPVDNSTQKQRAEACVARFDPEHKAPQVMTYDSATGTETHMNTEGRNVAVTAQNAQDNTALGMGGKVGGNMPAACTDYQPGVAPAAPAGPPHHKSSYNGYQ